VDLLLKHCSVERGREGIGVCGRWPGMRNRRQGGFWWDFGGESVPGLHMGRW